MQILRGFAALLVVVLHATLMAQRKINPSTHVFNAGNAGVDIFFAISGFTMVMATARYWKQPGAALPFLKRRIIRIVPLYWLITLAEIIVVITIPSFAQHPPLLPLNTIASFLFIPAQNAEHHVHPVLDVGWTLSFEMFFYALFTLALALRVLPVLWLTVTLLLLSALSTLRTDAWPAPLTLIDPILLEFVLGMFIGQAALLSRTLPYPVAIGCVLLMLPVLAATSLYRVDYSHRHIIWGVPGALMLYGIVSLEDRFGTVFQKMTLPCLLGDISYALYLSHDLVLLACFTVFAKLLPGALHTSLILGIFVSCIAGIAIHCGLERPLLKRCNVGFKRIPTVSA